MDTSCDVVRKIFDFFVVNLVGTDNHTQLSTGLDGVSFHDTGIAHGDILQVVQTLHIGLDDFAACTGTGARNRITHLHNGGNERGHLHFIVVRTDRIANIRFLLVLLSNFGTVDGVREFGFLIGHLTYVVEQAGTLCLLGVQSEFGRHDAAKIGCFARVLEQILPIRRAVLHFTDNANQFGVQTVDTEVNRRTLTRFDHFFVDLLFHLAHHFFDAGGVNTAVRNQVVECQTRHFATNGVESADNNSFGGVIDNDFYAGRRFQGTNVSSFAANNATFHVVILDMENRDAVFNCRFGGHTLNGLNDNALRLLVGIDFRLIHDLVDVALGVRLCFCLQTLDQMIARLFGRDARQLFEFGNLAFVHTPQLFFLAGKELFLILESALLRIEFLLATVHVLLALIDDHLALLEFVFRLQNALAALLHFLFELRFLVEELLFDFEQLFLFDDLGFFFSLFQLSVEHSGQHISEKEISAAGTDDDADQSDDE